MYENMYMVCIRMCACTYVMCVHVYGIHTHVIYVTCVRYEYVCDVCVNVYGMDTYMISVYMCQVCLRMCACTWEHVHGT